MHAVLEAQGGLACLALATFMLFLGTSNDDAERGVSRIVIASLFISGVLDSFHAALQPGNAFVWLRTCSTCAGGLMLASQCLPRRLVWWRGLPWVALAASLLIGAGSLAAPQALPLMAREGVFSRPRPKA